MINWNKIVNSQIKPQIDKSDMLRYKRLKAFFNAIKWSDLTNNERSSLDGIRCVMYSHTWVTEKQYHLVRYLCLMSNGGNSKPNNPVHVIETVYK